MKQKNTKIERHHFKTVYSTNTWALQNAARLNPDAITIITAEEQSAGRGRLNRIWHSPADGNLYITFCLFVEKELDGIPNIPQVLALTVATVLEQIKINAKLKWPNDIVIEGKKVGGILCETKLIGNRRFIALGLGLNINASENLPSNATSLFVECGKEQCVDSIKTLLEEHFTESLKIFWKEKFSYFYETFRNKLYLPKELYFHHSNKTVKGSFKSLNNDGSLTLILETGEEKAFTYGEILFYTDRE